MTMPIEKELPEQCCDKCGRIEKNYYAFDEVSICSQCYTTIKNVIKGYVTMYKMARELKYHRAKQKVKK